MKANVTISQVWHNPSLMGFFMRKQAQDNFFDLVTDTFEERTSEVLSAIENTYEDLDDFEEMMYNLVAENLIEDIALETGLTLIEDSEEDETEE